MKLARFSLDIFLFYAAYAWPMIILVYMYLHFKHPELVYLPRRLDTWKSCANLQLW